MWQSHTSLGVAVIIGEANIICRRQTSFKKRTFVLVDKSAFFVAKEQQKGVHIFKMRILILAHQFEIFALEFFSRFFRTETTASFSEWSNVIFAVLINAVFFVNFEFSCFKFSKVLCGEGVGRYP